MNAGGNARGASGASAPRRLRSHPQGTGRGAAAATPTGRHLTAAAVRSAAGRATWWRLPPTSKIPRNLLGSPLPGNPQRGGSADRRRGRRPRRSRRGAPRRRAVASIGYWPDAAPTGRARRHHRLRSPAATHRVRHHPDARAVAKRQAAAAVVVVAVPAYLRACALRLLPARPRRPASLWTRARGLVAPPPRWRPGYVWPPP